MRIKFIILILLLVTCITTDVAAPQIDAPDISATVPTTVTTEFTTAPATEPPTKPVTEPIYEEIDIPVIELPEVESFRTIYDVENAIALCTDMVVEYDEILTSIHSEHPQYDEVLDIKITLLHFIDECRDVLDNHWTSRENRRPVMTHIWQDLKSYGYSDAVVSGIIGNMIAETGGMGHQDIEWDISANGYYGICMWALKYVPEIEGANLDEQLDYLKASIEYEMDTVYSKSFRKRFGMLNMDYDKFCAMDNPYDAAIAFAVCYERCAARYVERRGPQAEKAYEYFTTLGSWPWPGK